MIRLHRQNGPAPAKWREVVEKALPSHAAYVREAARFERFTLNSATRQDGFVRFAGHVLVKNEFPRCWSVGKDALFEMSHHKCAYCEVELNSNRAGHVEHFKPKKLFPSLAYEWTNYFLACAGCNGSKGDKWLERGEYVRPDRGNPAEAFRFGTDGSIHAAGGSRVAQRTIVDFDLKRRVLVRRRRFHIEQMLELLEDVKGFVDDPKKQRQFVVKQYERITDPGRVYSAALADCFLASWAGAVVKASSSKRRRSPG